MSHQYTLTELLAFKVFKDNHRFYQPDLKRMIVEWASSELSEENSSEALMILASLGLDENIDEYEFAHYLRLYLLESKITIPTKAYSSLIWLRYYLQDIFNSRSLVELESNFELVGNNFFNIDNYFFSRVIRMLYIEYDKILDYWEEENPPIFDDVISILDKKIKPVLKVLAHKEWVRLLVRAM